METEENITRNVDVDNILYFHGGSGNHGCEALVRTITDICDLKNVKLYSKAPEEDIKFGIQAEAKQSNLDTEELEDNYENTIAYSIGGDNYSYYYTAKILGNYNINFKKRGAKTTLIGCSINEDLFSFDDVVRDLKSYDLVTARESITYNNLIKSGINAYLIPDSAFTLKTIYKDWDNEKETIGINLSSLIQGLEKDKGIIYENYKVLIDYIIENTDYNIALIPHVIQSFNDDLKTLTNLYNEYKETNRVVLIEDCNCMELKGYIARCKMLIASRTHASIAGYSSCIPTLVTGYSVKSKGIARDIFGTDVNYVIPINNLQTKDDLKNGFIWLEQNYDKTRKHLEDSMTEYINRCYILKTWVDKL